MITEPIPVTAEKNTSATGTSVPSLHGLHLLKAVMSSVVWSEPPVSAIYGFGSCFSTKRNEGITLMCHGRSASPS